MAEVTVPQIEYNNQTGEFEQTGANHVHMESEDRANYITTMQSNFYAQELQRQADERNYAFLREQRDYDSPAEQVKRFEAAGLNPAMMMGQFDNGNQAQQLGSTASDVKDFKPNRGDQIKQANIDRMLEGMQTGLQAKRFELESKQLDLEKQRVDNDTVRAQNDSRRLGNETRRTSADISKIWSDIGLNAKQGAKLDAETRNAYKTFDEIRSRIDLNEANSEKIRTEIPNIIKERDILDATQRKLVSETGLNWKQCDYLGQKILESVQETVLTELKSEYQNTENGYQHLTHMYDNQIKRLDAEMRSWSLKQGMKYDDQKNISSIAASYSSAMHSAISSVKDALMSGVLLGIMPK